jgi:Ca2+-binding EF-hand superfamily protein
MRRFLAGGLGALLLVTGGLWLWQGQASREIEIPAAPPPTMIPDKLPEAGPNAPAFGAAPPTPPEAPKASREEVRFNRYDRNRDELISRVEMMGSRTKAFKTLDKDENNLLSFEEWAVATGERFAGADANKDKLLTRKEFASTRPKQAAKPECRC